MKNVPPFSFASYSNVCDIHTVSNKQMVIDLVSKLPENTPLEDIAREIELWAGIKAAREQASRRQGIPAEDARKLIDESVAR